MRNSCGKGSARMSAGCGRSFLNVPSVNDLKRIGRGERFFPVYFSSVAFGLNGGGNAAIIGLGGTGESALLSTAADVLAPDVIKRRNFVFAAESFFF